MRAFYVAQAGLELLGSSDPSTLSFSSAGITGVIQCTWLCSFFLFFFLRQSLTLSPVWSIVAQSWLIATSASQVQEILLLQHPV